MLYSILSSFAKKLSGHLCMAYHLTDEAVILGPLGENRNSSASNKITLSLINIERETATGISFNYKSSSPRQTKKTSPAWQLNLYVLIAAVFGEKQYEEGLQLLSGTLLYIQSNYTFLPEGTGHSFTIEPVNLSFNELSNMWNLCGNNYYPSILCKIRMWNLDGGEIKSISRVIQTSDTNL